MKRYLFLLLTAFFSGTVLWGATISFTGPKNMVVYLEKREVGKAPLTVSVKPQTSYVFKYVAPGFEPKWEVISLKREGNYNNAVVLQPISASVMITSSPRGAVLYLNGVKNKATPLVLEKQPLGKYTGELRMPGFAPMQIEWEVKDERPIRKDFKLQVNNGKLRITSVPSGAAVSVDGKDEGFTPRTLTLAEGAYQVQVSKNGFLTQTNEVTVFRGKEIRHNVDLQEVPGAVNLNTSPSGAAVFLKNKKLGTTPLLLKSLTPGVYIFTFKKNGFDDLTETVTILPGKTEKVDVQLATYFGSLELYVKPAGVSVFLDGKFISKVKPDHASAGTKPVIIENLRAGMHRLKLSHPNAVPQVNNYEVEVVRNKQTLKKYQVWVPDCEVTYRRNGRREVGILISETADEILFSPEAGVQFTLYKKDISFRKLKNY